MLLRRRAWDLAAGLQEAAAAGLLAGAGAELAFADFEIEDLNPRRFAQKHLSAI